MAIHAFYSNFLIAFLSFILPVEDCSSGSRKLVVFNHFSQRSFLNFKYLSSWLRSFNIFNLSYGNKMVTPQRVSRKPDLEYSLKTVFWEFCVGFKTLTVHMRNEPKVLTFYSLCILLATLITIKRQYIHIQIYLTDVLSHSISWKHLLKDQSKFS